MMIGVRKRRFLPVPPMAELPNLEKSQVRSATLPVAGPSSEWLNKQYEFIGGRHRGDVVECLTAGNRALQTSEMKQHDLNRAVIAICWDLAKRIIEDDSEYKTICELERWKHRHRKPKAEDNDARRCHFLALLMFSGVSKENDNAATKKGRMLDYLVKANFSEDDIIEQLNNPGGVTGVYEEALKKYPRTETWNRKLRSSVQSNRSAAARKSNVGGSHNKIGGGDLGRFLQEHIEGIYGNGDLEASTMLASANDQAIFAEMSPGDKYEVTIERVDCDGDHLVLRASDPRATCKPKHF